MSGIVERTNLGAGVRPYGFAYDDAQERNALPFPETRYGNPGPGGTYDYWHLSQFAIPAGTATAEVVDLTALHGAPGEASRQAEPTKHLQASYDDGSGLIQVSYEAACDSTDTTIYYGPLASVSNYGYSGAVCNIGATGSAAFDPGPGDFFFLTVGHNATVEGSYGTDGDGTERPEDVGTPGCDLVQDLSETCDS